MHSRTRTITATLLALPVLTFYGLLLYPWDFTDNRGFGWMLLLVLYLISAICLVCNLISLLLFLKDRRKIIWIILFVVNLFPVVQGFVIPILISYFRN